MICSHLVVIECLFSMECSIYGTGRLILKGFCPVVNHKCSLSSNRQRLAELLKSKKPGDLQEANQLIKNMVKEVPESQPVFASFTSWR